ncbi:MAG: AAA family ATPase [Spirochaetaceae bacterium]|nr:AAA family ATPase [Spirochaetaceae bacterium]
MKIITGISRCGKSIVLQQVRDEIAHQTDNIIFLEFENRRIKNLIPDVDSLYHSNQSSSIWGIIHKNVTRLLNKLSLVIIPIFFIIHFQKLLRSNSLNS